MGRAYRGPYARPSSYPVPYATAAVWGTGIDDIHSYYGEGPPLRVLGRSGHIGGSPVANDGPRDRNYQNPMDSAGIDPPEEVTWGYPADDYTLDSWGSGANASPSDVAPGIDTIMDDRPEWNIDPAGMSNRRSTLGQPPWGTGGFAFRAIMGGVRRRTRGKNGGSLRTSAQLPNETVSEGWLNKVTSFIADANPSADEQIFIQTSMRQRYLAKDNGRAVLRATDDERHTINSRVEAMVEKVYSDGERHYDMDPFQADEIERPFRFRSAGVGPAEWMEANEFGPMMPWQRTPPADPSMGVPEVPDNSYGYTQEDSMYYG